MLEILFLTNDIEIKQTNKHNITIHDLITNIFKKSLRECTIYKTDSEFVPITIIPHTLPITSKLKYILVDYRRTIGSYYTRHENNIYVHPSEYFAYQHAIATVTGVTKHYPNPKQYFHDLQCNDVTIQPIIDIQYPNYDRMLYTKKRTYRSIKLKWRTDDHYIIPWSDIIFCHRCKESIMYYCGTCKQLLCCDGDLCSDNLCCNLLDLNCITCRNKTCKPDDKLCRSCKKHTCSTCGLNEDDLCSNCSDDITWLVDDTDDHKYGISNVFKTKNSAYDFAIKGLTKQLLNIKQLISTGTDKKAEYDYLKKNYSFKYSYEIIEVKHEHDNEMTF